MGRRIGVRVMVRWQFGELIARLKRRPHYTDRGRTIWVAMAEDQELIGLGDVRRCYELAIDGEVPLGNLQPPGVAGKASPEGRRDGDLHFLVGCLHLVTSFEAPAPQTARIKRASKRFVSNCVRT